jgi:hypothetical protein
MQVMQLTHQGHAFAIKGTTVKEILRIRIIVLHVEQAAQAVRQRYAAHALTQTHT